MTHARRALGAAGEAAAAEHLQEQGYTILARGWRGAGREIDLIAERDGVVVFVEVKTRRPGGIAPAVTAVDWRKQRQIAAAARVAAHSLGTRARAFRFDVIGVTPGPDGPAIEHLEDAFRPG